MIQLFFTCHDLTGVFALVSRFKARSFSPAPHKYPSLAKYMGTIQCVNSVDAIERPFHHHLRFWLFRILPGCTYVVTVFNILIIILVRVHCDAAVES